MHILVVDDEPDIRQLVTDILTMGQDPYEISEAGDGEEALMRVAERKPDLIILDIRMPRMDGIEVCRKLKSAPETKSIPIMMLTVKSTLEAREEGFDCGAALYLTKPFDPEELRRLVHGILSGEIH